MSEIKRVAFTTISSSASSTNASTNNLNIGSSGGGFGASSSFSSTSGSGGSGVGGGGGGNSVITTSSAAFHRFGVPDPVTSQKSTGGLSSTGAAATTTTSGSKPNKTIRLNMELFASNSNSFPEFNYSKLIHLEKKKLKKLKSKQNGFSDPFEDNDEDVARIAKELEKKYGTSYASGRGRSKKDDFCDIGLGYDENDSFIDNTEAYDEIIPEEVETVEGGFYINSGALVFKQLSSCTEKTDEIIKMPNKTRKRALSSSSEESGSSGDENNAENKTEAPTTSSPTSTVTNAQQSAIPKVSTSSGSSSSSKQKHGLSSEKRHKTTSDKESSDKEKSSSKSKSSSAATSSVTSLASGSPKNDDIGSESNAKDKPRIDRTVKTTTVKDMLKAKRDSFLKMQEEELKSKASNGEVKPATSTEDLSGSDSSSDESDSNLEPNAKKLKKTDEESDKLRSSDAPLTDLSDDLIRDIQTMKDTAKASNRTGKKFHFDEKLTDMFLGIDDKCFCLDKHIRNNVFAHLEYQLSLPKYYLLRKAKQLRINQEKTKTKKAFVKLRKAVTEAMPYLLQQYQANYTKYEEFLSLNPGVDTHKLENAPKMPKKRFQWNDTTRSLLYDLYQVRWMSFTVLGTRKDSFEDFVSNFLKDKVINIWPSGWMKLEEIKREIEKKKNAPKKLKENKKPDESQSTAEKPHNLNPDVVSLSSQLSINTTDNHPTTSSNEHTTAKPIDVTKLLPAHGSSSTNDPIHSSSKAYSSSSSSGKVHRSSTNSPLNLCSSQGSSSKNSVINNNNNANPNQNLNSNRTTTGTVNISKNHIDLVSPSKRTDHSINSIMSSPSSTSSSVSTTPQPQHSAGTMGGGGSSISSNMDNNTHVINIDNFKSASEIINTSNQLLNHNSKTHSQNDRQKSRSSGASEVQQSHSPVPLKPDYSRRDSSSESDGVEIVGVYRSTTALPVVKNKYKKSSQGSRSDSPGTHDKPKTAIATTAALPKKQLECTDLDVNKIMKALKELEELQQTGNFVPDISSFTNSNHNANTSPLAYGKDLTQ